MFVLVSATFYMAFKKLNLLCLVEFLIASDSMIDQYVVSEIASCFKYVIQMHLLNGNI